MSNWAIVIGIDRYTQPQHRLYAAVSDALRVSRWLLNPNGGDVPPAQMRLLLSPHDPLPDTSGLPDPLSADRLQVITAINQVLDQSGGQGHRLFFYFAGHGMSARVDLTNLSAILTSDFHTELPDQSISLQSLFEHCQSSQFAEQYFLLDACRDIAFQQEIRIGYIPKPRQPITPPPPQYVMYATQSGAKAMELRAPGERGGAFTTALIAGLGGGGAAKRWDDNAGRYEVRWNALFNFVRAEVARLKLAAGNGTNGPLTQEPRSDGEKAGADPVLAHINPAMVANETISIRVQPATHLGGATVEARDLNKDHREGPPLLSPHPLELPPRTYRVSAMAPDNLLGTRVIELYESQEVTLELRPTGPTSPGLIGLAVPGSRSLGGDGMESTGDGSSIQTRRSSVPLIVQAIDSLTRVELTSSSGALIAGQRGRVSSNVAPGFYRTRVISPEGDFHETPLEVSGFERRVVVQAEAPAAASAAMSALLELGSFPTKPDGSVKVSEAVGEVAFVQPSTILAMAAAANFERDNLYGHGLRRLPIPSFLELAGNAASGALVLLGDEEAKGDRWKQTTVRFVLQKHAASKEPHRTQETGVPGVFVSAFALSPDPYWLEILAADGSMFSMPVHVLPDHVALIMLMQTSGQDFQVHLYQVQAVPDKTRHGYDPNNDSARFAAIRRIELMQRNVAHGRITPIVPDLEQMLKLEWLDPIAASLGLYALIRLGRWNDVQPLAEALRTRFPKLPDPWIASACHANYIGDKAAREHSLKAFAAGCSSFRDGINLLRRLLKDGGAEGDAQRLDALADRILPDSFWAASPESLALAWAASAKRRSRVKGMKIVRGHTRSAG